MPMTRVFITGLKPMLSDVVRAVVANDPALSLVGECAAVDLDRAAPAEPDLVVLPLDQATDADLYAFLATHCRTGVLGLAADGRTAAVYEMRPHRTSLGDLGIDGLAAALHRTRGGR